MSGAPRRNGLPRRDAVPYYLRKGPSGSVTSLNDGGLSAEQAGGGRGSHQLYLSGLGVGQRRCGRRSGRTSGPGTARAHLHQRAARGRSRSHRADRAQALASSTAIDTQFIVKLADQHPQNDAARKSGEQPGIHAGVEGLAESLASREGPEALDADAAVLHPHQSAADHARRDLRFDIEVLPISYVFKKGHRIRLELANGDSPATDGVFSHPYHPTQMGTDTIHHDAHACFVHHVAGGFIAAQQENRREATP